MRNTFLVVKDIYKNSVRVNIDHIVSYKTNGPFTEVALLNETVNTEMTPEEIDQALTELYFMVKRYE
jgi:hypothetical protein